MQFLKSAAVAAGFMIVAATASAYAATITFNGTVGDAGFTQITTGNTYSEAGFTLTTQADRVFIIDNDYDGTLVGFDDDMMELDNTGASVLLTADSGDPFDLVSMVIGALGENAVLQFEGTFAGGGTISTMVDAIAGNMDLTLFAGFTNLISLRIFADTDGEYPAFDNIVLNEYVSDVPIPAALPLFLAGIAGFGAVSRRRKNAA